MAKFVLIFRAAKHGYAVHLELNSLTSDILIGALEKAMNDEDMKKRVQSVSRQFHDQKDDPVEKGVWWIEYVMRNEGALFLRPESLNLYWFQYIGLDIVIFLGVIILLSIHMMRRIISKTKVLDARDENAKNKKLVQRQDDKEVKEETHKSDDDNQDLQKGNATKYFDCIDNSSSLDIRRR